MIISNKRKVKMPQLGLLVLMVITLLMPPQIAAEDRIVQVGYIPKEKKTGNPVEAYGGMIMKVDTIFYWIGSSNPTLLTNPSVNCYQSTDLIEWTSCGVLISANKI